MKYLLLLISILLIPLNAYAFVAQGYYSTQGSGSSQSMGSTSLFVSWEGTWSDPTYTLDSNDFSLGDTTGTESGTLDVNTDSEYIGSYGLETAGAYDYIIFDPTTIVNNEEGSFSFWMRFNGSGLPSNYDSFLILREDSNNYMRCMIYDTNEISLQWVEGGANVSRATTDAANLVVGTWYFVTGSYVAPGLGGSNVTLEIAVYNTSISLIDSATDGPDSASGITVAYIWHGMYGSYADDCNFDNLDISTESSDDHTVWAEEATYP